MPDFMNEVFSFPTDWLAQCNQRVARRVCWQHEFQGICRHYYKRSAGQSCLCVHTKGRGKDWSVIYHAYLSPLQLIEEDNFRNMYLNTICLFLDNFLSHFMQIKNLPQGATVIDYAYMIHTEIGNKMVAAKVSLVTFAC